MLTFLLLYTDISLPFLKAEQARLSQASFPHPALQLPVTLVVLHWACCTTSVRYWGIQLCTKHSRCSLINVYEMGRIITWLLLLGILPTDVQFFLHLDLQGIFCRAVSHHSALRLSTCIPLFCLGSKTLHLFQYAPLSLFPLRSSQTTALPSTSRTAASG